MRSLEYASIQWGLIFGIVLSIINVLLAAPLFSADYVTALLQGSTAASASFTLTLCASSFLILAALTAAGVLAARETGTIRGGMWAGGIAAFASYIMTFVLNTIILPNSRLGSTINFNMPGGTTNAAVTSCIVGCGVVNLVINCAWYGTLAIPGAWFGRWLYDRGADDGGEEYDEYQEGTYPGPMPGGYPVFPQQGMPQPGYPQPGYPPQQGGGWGAPPPEYGPPPGSGYGPPPGYGPPSGPGGYPPQSPPPRRY